MDKYKVLKTVFGHDSFRDGQEKLVDELLAGYDVMGVMPTGAGKSICYQLPALLMPGVTLVVSPLISLMKDQVMALKASGVAAAYINSSLTPGQQSEAIRRASLGMYKIIYVAPERLHMPQFVAFAKQADISLLAVDEAHCVSQWGQDFRPSYLHIAEFVEQLPKRPPVAAFTATATRQVRDDIVKMLKLVEPFCLTTGYNRPNLRFTSVKPTSKFGMLTEFLEGMAGECGIIYCSTRKTVEDVAHKLREAGFAATRYHAGLTDEERRANQDAFRFDEAKIMVATNAFGMGIDKSNVRFVVHYNMPRDLESYYQEAGRAGRDGEPAECLLLYSGQDVITGRWMIEHNEVNPEIAPELRRELQSRDLERLRQMTFYATCKGCLRQFILRYFGENDAPERCDNCSVCDDEPFEVDNGKNRTVRTAKERRRHEGDVHFTSWEKALFDNLKTLRALLAARKRVPAYTIFSDAALTDMVRKKPQDLHAFLDVSGVGVAKQEKYGPVFLAVIRDGREPNDAMEEYTPTRRVTDGSAKGKSWTDDEERQLQQEYEGGFTIAEISRRHGRTRGAIAARLRKMELIE